MSDGDLVFRYPKRTHGNLVFGSDAGGEIPTAEIVALATLQRPSWSGTVQLIEELVAYAVLVRPSGWTGQVVYDTDTQRPLVGHVVAGFQDGVDRCDGATAAFQDAQATSAAAQALYQDAVSLAASTVARAQDSARLWRGVDVRVQDGLGVAASVRPGFQDAARRDAGGRVAFQHGDPRQARATDSMRDGLRLTAPGSISRFQDGRLVLVGSRHRGGLGVGVEVGAASRFQDGRAPRPGIYTPPGPQPQDPCYVPDGNLLFAGAYAVDGNLIFVCERHDGPGPEPGETVVVPIRRAYIVKNTISLTRVDGGVAIPASAFSMSIDADSWTWQWSATLPGAALPLIESTDGQPVDVLATINGVGYRLCVERYSRERRFASSKISVSGRGRAAILDAPYAPVLNHVGGSAATIEQLLGQVLTINGVGIGWDIDFGIDDWLVPANTWALQGTYIAGVLDIAGAAGAIVQPHRTDPTLRILPRYPAAPWHWGDVTPDFELPAAAVAVEGIEWVTRPDYNRVFVLGATSGGVTGQVTRAGTAGDVVAPQVTHSLITHVDGVRQRGLPELANTGRQAQVSLRLQVLPETGIIVPGQFVRYVDGGETRMGLVRGTSLDGFPQLRQSITLETHLEEA